MDTHFTCLQNQLRTGPAPTTKTCRTRFFFSGDASGQYCHSGQLSFRTLYRDVLGVEDYELTRGEGMEWKVIHGDEGLPRFTERAWSCQPMDGVSRREPRRWQWPMESAWTMAKALQDGVAGARFLLLLDRLPLRLIVTDRLPKTSYQSLRRW
jgi:hypothetical protein